MRKKISFSFNVLNAFWLYNFYRWMLLMLKLKLPSLNKIFNVATEYLCVLADCLFAF